MAFLLNLAKSALGGILSAGKGIIGNLFSGGSGSAVAQRIVPMIANATGMDTDQVNKNVDYLYDRTAGVVNTLSSKLDNLQSKLSGVGRLQPTYTDTPYTDEGNIPVPSGGNVGEAYQRGMKETSDRLLGLFDSFLSRRGYGKNGGEGGGGGGGYQGDVPMSSYGGGRMNPVGTQQQTSVTRQRPRSATGLRNI